MKLSKDQYLKAERKCLSAAVTEWSVTRDQTPGTNLRISQIHVLLTSLGQHVPLKISVGFAKDWRNIIFQRGRRFHAFSTWKNLEQPSYIYIYLYIYTLDANNVHKHELVTYPELWGKLMELFVQKCTIVKVHCEHWRIQRDVFKRVTSFALQICTTHFTQKFCSVLLAQLIFAQPILPSSFDTKHLGYPILQSLPRTASMRSYLAQLIHILHGQSILNRCPAQPILNYNCDDASLYFISPALFTVWEVGFSVQQIHYWMYCGETQNHLNQPNQLGLDMYSRRCLNMSEDHAITHRNVWVWGVIAFKSKA